VSQQQQSQPQRRAFKVPVHLSKRTASSTIASSSNAFTAKARYHHHFPQLVLRAEPSR